MSASRPAPAQYKFFGRVIPERRRVTLPPIVPIAYRDATLEAQFNLSIVKGAITVTCTPSGEGADTNLCLFRAVELVTAAVDAFAFSKGWALLVVFDDVIINDQPMRGLALTESSVQPFATALKSEDELEALIPIILNDFNLKFALRDLVASLHTLNYSAIAAARSVETIRVALSPKNPNDKQAWEHMRDVLNIDMEFLKSITDASRGPRHGRRAISGELQVVVTRRAWAVVNRYIAYLRQGKRPLDTSEYPLLIT